MSAALLLALGLAGGGSAPADAELLALGERRMASLCLSCHELDGPPSRNPLRPRVKGWTEDEAYRNVARLHELDPRMILEFEGTERERRALAAALARLGAREDPAPPWDALAVLAGLGLGAAAFRLLAGRRRRAR